MVEKDEKNKRVSEHNPKGLPAPDDLTFSTLWEQATSQKGFFASLEDAGFYLCYATALKRRKDINTALEAAGLPLLREMPRARKVDSVDTEGIAEMMARIRKVAERAESEKEQAPA